MIDLKNSEISQIVPEYFREKPEVLALSYAIGAEVKKLVEYADQVNIFGNIDNQPDDVLDALAVQFDTQYYDENLPTENKRSLIKNTFSWFKKAGTVAAVEELISSIWGGASEVREWFDYAGDAGTFRVFIDISHTSPDNPAHDYDLDILEQRIKAIKRESAHLDSVSFMIKNGIKIGKSIQCWLVDPPRCGTILCGTYPTPSTLGYTESNTLAIVPEVDPYAYTPDLCGTLPDIQTVGYSVHSEEILSGAADGYSINPIYCGILNCGED